MWPTRRTAQAAVLLAVLAATAYVYYAVVVGGVRVPAQWTSAQTSAPSAAAAGPTTAALSQRPTSPGRGSTAHLDAPSATPTAAATAA